MVTAKNAGVATITALAKDGTGKKAVCKVTVVNNVMSIAISGDKQVAKGKNIKLTATVTPAKSKNAALVWSVSPAGMGVTVTNGKVVATKNADPAVTYEITAATKDGSITSKPYSVKVVAGAISTIKFPNKAETIFAVKGNYNAPTSIQLSPAITGTEGFNASLVEYTSNATGVATVNKSTGLVTAKAPGKAVITCKALDGSNKKATVTVNVNIPMSGLKVAPKKECENLIAKGKSVQYGVLYYSDFGTPTNTNVKWTSSDPSVATVDAKGNVRGVTVGSFATITATAADGSGASASYEIKVVKAPSYFYSYDYYGNRYYDYGLFVLGTDAGVISEETVKNGGARGGLMYKVEVKGPKDGAVFAEPYLDAAGVYFLKKGTYTVTITLLDGSGRKTSCKHICTKDSTLD